VLIINDLQVTVEQLTQELNIIEQRYPHDVSLQLKALAEFFEKVYANANPKRMFVHKPISEIIGKCFIFWKRGGKLFICLLVVGIPYDYLNADTLEVLRKWLEKMNKTSLVSFFWFLLSLMFAMANGGNITRGESNNNDDDDDDDDDNNNNNKNKNNKNNKNKNNKTTKQQNNDNNNKITTTTNTTFIQRKWERQE
jgi:hypothetical protein